MPSQHYGSSWLVPLVTAGITVVAMNGSLGNFLLNPAFAAGVGASVAYGVGSYVYDLKFDSTQFVKTALFPAAAVYIGMTAFSIQSPLLIGLLAALFASKGYFDSFTFWDLKPLSLNAPYNPIVDGN